MVRSHTSTRRFFCRPSSVSLDATGLAAPKPVTVTGAMPLRRNSSATTLALLRESVRAGGLQYYPVFGNVSFRLSLANLSHRKVSEQARVSFRP